MYSCVFRTEAEETVEHRSRFIVNVEYRRLIREIDYKSPRPPYLDYDQLSLLLRYGKVLQYVFLHVIYEFKHLGR